MSNVFDSYAQCRPAARRMVTAATFAVITVPAAPLLAIGTAHTALAAVGVFVSILFYATGYATAAVRYGRRMHAAVADARRDALTGLPTRAVADHLLQAATREGTQLAVALADVDGLHAINVNFGLAAGDQYITAVAQRLARAVPAGGCLVRQGGDEFTIIAPNIDPDELATAIGAAIAGPAIIAGHRIQPRASVGIAASGGGDANYARACADAAIYTAKAAGGNHTMVYQPDRDGHPALDGTCPLVRRRDIDPLRQDGAWLPTPGDELLPLLWSVDEAYTIHEALCAARDRWAKVGAEVRAGAEQADTAGRGVADRMNLEPTPGSYQSIARIADEEQAKHACLADRMTPIIEAAQGPDDSGSRRLVRRDVPPAGCRK